MQSCKLYRYFYIFLGPLFKRRITFQISRTGHCGMVMQIVLFLKEMLNNFCAVQKFVLDFSFRLFPEQP